MKSEWVPFYDSLRRGNKRGLSRAVRFVYLELSLEARSFGGFLPLVGKTDLDAVHDLLGGSRAEIATALKLLAVPRDPSDPDDEPMIRLFGDPGSRVLEVVAHDVYVKTDKSAARMRKHRDKKKRQREQLLLTSGDASHAVTSNVTVTPSLDRGVTPQRREEERREEEIPPKPPEGAGGAEVIEGEVVAPLPLLGAAGDGHFGMLESEWKRLARVRTGRDQTNLSNFERERLRELVRVHASNTPDKIAWLRDAFARFAESDYPTHGGFKPSRCASWFDDGCPPPRSPVGASQRFHREGRHAEPEWKPPPKPEPVPVAAIEEMLSKTGFHGLKRLP